MLKSYCPSLHGLDHVKIGLLC